MKKTRVVMKVTVFFLLVAAVTVLADKPKVIKAIPDNGNENVAPTLEQIRIEFDQDMDGGGFSICGGGPKFPELLGTGWRGKIAWTDIEVVNNPLGQPEVSITGEVKKIADEKNIKQISLSITHTANFVIASAVALVE